MLDYYCCRSLRKSSMLLIFVVALIDFHALLIAAESTAIVNTSTGPVQGIILKTVNSVPYAVFKGIRFAEPPIGFLRFKPPVPIKPWTATLNATTDGPNCMQPVNIFGILSGLPNSEDCLFLNVHTPTTNLEVLPKVLNPVMVFIYGGGFDSGTSSSLFYRPDYLTEKRVVYVALNYRLGPLGFLNLNHPNATGNQGLKDQVLALKWVKKNIANFGGDPNKVTIFGQSAGGSSVGFHILSAASAGLFRAAISMSGVPFHPWAFSSPGKALDKSISLGSLLGTNSTDKETLLKTFYEISAEDLTAAAKKISPAFSAFLPTIENKSIATDAFLTKCPIDLYLTGNFNKVPQILGFMNKESVRWGSNMQSLVVIANVALEVANYLGINLPNCLALIEAEKNSSTNSLDKIDDKTIDGVIQETTDILFVAELDATQQLLSNRKNRNTVYYYHYSFYTSTLFHNLISNNTLLGPGHGDDLPFVFAIPLANYSRDPEDPTRKTIQRVTTMFTNFAKYGNPTPSCAPNDSVGITWPNSGILGRSLNIGAELSVDFRPTDDMTKRIEEKGASKIRDASGCSFYDCHGHAIVN